VGRLAGSEYEDGQTARNEVLRVIDSLKVQTSKPKEVEMVVDIDFSSYLSETAAVNIRLNAEVERLRQSTSDFAGLSETVCRSNFARKSSGAHCLSRENKAAEIELSLNQLEAKKILHNLPKILLCENPLRDGVNRILFRVKNLSISIALGVGLLSKVR